ncbi:sugar porter family MFS transporter [Streptomyces sp. NPDC049910]|uniref:sugar porter family MFS transporter n=1 Tax=Streptomyces sp. NPDC049910 TaxID=3155278 RepID=UPI003428BB65
MRDTRASERSGDSPPGFHLTLVAAGAALGGFLFGYDSAVINGAITGIREHFAVGAAETGVTVSSALLGAAAGSVAAGWGADRMGRLRVMRISAVLFALSGVGSAIPVSIEVLTGWRIVGGVAIGLASAVAPGYIAEIAPPALRGRLTSFQQLAIVLGIAMSQLANYVIATAAGGSSEGQLGSAQAWQWMLAVEAAPAVLYGLATLVLPESPRYLIAAGREDHARAVLQRLEGSSVDLSARIADIRRVMQTDRKPRLRDLRNGALGLMPVVWVGMGASVLQQLFGINVIFYYSSVLWESVGIDESGSLLISLSTSVINIVGTLIAMALVDKVGRKPLAVAGSVGMAIGLSVLAWSFSFLAEDDSRLPTGPAVAALIAAHFFVLCFAFSWGVVVWVLLSEMFPNRIRAIALAVGVAAQWIANWVVTVTFPVLSEWNLSATYAGYAFFAVASIPFVIFLVQEGKDRTLESMG